MVWPLRSCHAPALAGGLRVTGCYNEMSRGPFYTMIARPSQTTAAGESRPFRADCSAHGQDKSLKTSKPSAASSMARPLFAQINLAALSANLARVRELASGTQVLAVVKADAYGHGLLRVLPALEQADGLALLELDAAVMLRERHYMRRILLLEGFFEERELSEIAQRRLAVVVHHLDQVRMLERAALMRPLEVFVKVNTGMNRLGFAVDEVAGVCDRLARSSGVAALRLMTHLARADDDDGVKVPLEAFEIACKGLPYPRSI